MLRTTTTTTTTSSNNNNNNKLFPSLPLFVVLLTTLVSVVDGQRRLPLNDTTIREAVELYTSESPADVGRLLSTYGELADWDTSDVTDMSGLFESVTLPTSALDLSNWDVSRVTTMRNMFRNARLNQQQQQTTVCFTTLGSTVNAKLTDLLDVTGMFCGTQAGLDPCCTPNEQLLEASCCREQQGASCNSFCLDSEGVPETPAPTTTPTSTSTPTQTVPAVVATDQGEYVFDENGGDRPDDDLYNSNNHQDATEVNQTVVVPQENNNNDSPSEAEKDSFNNSDNNINNSNRTKTSSWYQSAWFLTLLGFLVGCVLLVAAFLVYKKKQQQSQKGMTAHDDSDNNNNNNNHDLVLKEAPSPPLESMIAIAIQPTADSSETDSNSHYGGGGRGASGAQPGMEDIECNLSMAEDVPVSDTDNYDSYDHANISHVVQDDQPSMDAPMYDQASDDESVEVSRTNNNSNDKSLYDL